MASGCSSAASSRCCKLTATPGSSSAFSTWSSNCASTASNPLTCNVKLDQPATTQVAAVFSRTPVTTGGGLTLGGATGTVTLQCTSKILCDGTATIATGPPKPARDAAGGKPKRPAPPILLGSGTFKVKPHKRGTIHIHLTAAGKSLAKHHKLHAVTLTIITKQPKHKKLVSERTLRVRY